LQGRITLLMGPPGSGKSVFVKMLAGRFKPSPELRMSGSVKYNGCTPDEFVVSRTVGLVDQYDSAPLHPQRPVAILPRSETSTANLQQTSA
jgi:ABC-type multidrug transport system ATPase subunit